MLMINQFTESLIFPLFRSCLSQFLGRPPDEYVKEVDQAIEHARLKFHYTYGNNYGKSGSTFIDHQGNYKKLLRSTFPRGRRLTAAELNLEGFDESPKATEEAAAFFLDAFYETIDQTTSRSLDRDQLLQEGNAKLSEIYEGTTKNEAGIRLTIDRVDQLDSKLDSIINDQQFPASIRKIFAESSLTELSNLLKTGQIQKALDYALRHLTAIDTALEESTDLGNHYVADLRSYRQRFLFAAATAASWQGEIDAGRRFWRQARDLGPIDPEYHKQAAITLFNIRLKDELQHLIDQMDHGSEGYLKFAAPCLAYLQKDWFELEKLLTDIQSSDQILQRVEARIQIIDFEDVEAVKLTADLLNKTDDDIVLPVLNLIRALLTLDLLKQIITGYTPLEYDRRPLICKLVDRINLALETAEPDSSYYAQALGYLGMAGELLRDEELNERFKNGVDKLDRTIRSSTFPLYGADSTSDKIQLLQTNGHFDSISSTLLKAELHQNSALPENIESELYEILFASVDKKHKKVALLFLVQHLRRTKRTEQAQRLIDATPLRPADRWLIQVRNLPAGETLLGMVNEVESFPLDIEVIEHLINNATANVKFTSPESPPPSEDDLDWAEVALHWTDQLLKVLPSRSSRLRYAKALYTAKRYEELLEITPDLDPIYADQAAELHALALVGLGRKSEAIDCFIAASKNFPNSIHFIIYASYYLITENQPEIAINILEPQIKAGSQNPDILFLYAQSLYSRDPSSQDHASRAFDLFAKAYDLRPDSIIAQKAWQAARTAGRELEANHLFKAMMADAPVEVVETEKDFYQAMQAGRSHIVQIEGGLEYLPNMICREIKHQESLEMFLREHILSYVDFFQYSGKSWEIWTYWSLFQNSLFSPVVPAELRLKLVQSGRTTRIIGGGSVFCGFNQCFACTEVSVW